MLKFTAVIAAAAALMACGPKSEPPISGADLVSTAVAAHYAVTVDEVQKAGDGYAWVVSAVNGSGYAWEGTLYLKLVDVGNEVVESHDFEISEMVPPGGKTSGLKFDSPHAPVEMGGDIARLKAEVDVAAYEEPPGGGAD